MLIKGMLGKAPGVQVKKYSEGEIIRNAHQTTQRGAQHGTAGFECCCSRHCRSAETLSCQLMYPMCFSADSRHRHVCI